MPNSAQCALELGRREFRLSPGLRGLCAGVWPQRDVAQEKLPTFWDGFYCKTPKLCCLCLHNGNRLSQQRFMPEDLSLVLGFNWHFSF